MLPEYWKYKKYKLTVIGLDITNDCHELNPLATHIYTTLKSKWHQVRGVVRGFMLGLKPQDAQRDMYILNEDDDKQIDFTLDDLKYMYIYIEAK